MSGVIGGGIGQSSAIADDGGFGAKRSLPHHLRLFDPLQGPAQVGVILPGGNAPLTITEANALNAYHGLHCIDPAVDIEETAGAFTHCADASRNGDFAGYLTSEDAREVLLDALMLALDTYADLGISWHQVARAFAFPGSSNHRLVFTLLDWCQQYPRVRETLDGVVRDLRRAGRFRKEQS